MLHYERRNVRFLSDSTGATVYDTALNGPWTLAECSLSKPEKQTNYVEIPGRDGSIDLNDGLTGGEPRYKQRTLQIRLTCSERDRIFRTELIDDIVNTLDGFVFRIIHPDDPTRYIRGVCSVTVEYNDPAHCGVLIEALCDPWRVSMTGVYIDVTASGTAQTLVLTNRGRRRVVPYIGAYDDAPTMPNVSISSGTYSTTFTDYVGRNVSELALGYKQTRILTYSGSGHLTVQWREAIL